jgi:hypothetical protein
VGGVTTSLLPKPPNCGVDAENRIFGGTTTELSEFPWFALLKYTRREFGKGEWEWEVEWEIGGKLRENCGKLMRD